MSRGDAWLTALAAALGIAGCGKAPPAVSIVASREVTMWDATAPVDAETMDAVSDASAPGDPPPLRAPSPTQASIPVVDVLAPARVDSFVTQKVARPKTKGVAPTPRDPCARGRNTPECRAAANCGPVDSRSALRAGLEFDAHVGLAPKPGLDAAAAAKAAGAISAVERQSYLCAMDSVLDSMFITVELTPAASGDGVRAKVTSASSSPAFAACLAPFLETRAFVGAGTQSLRFDIAVRAVWN